MHRTLATLAAPAALVLAITACGSDDSDDTDASGSGASGASESSDEGGSAESGSDDGGSEEGGSAYCDAVQADLASAAVAYNPVIPGQTPDLEGLLAFLETAGAPEGLEAEHETWVAHLEQLDPSTFTPEPDDVGAARDALFDAQMDCR